MAAGYDVFAWFYERHWAGLFVESGLFALETLLLPYLPLHGRLLDVCCGTGQTAAALGRRGYRVCGLDLSTEMLRYAHKRAPQLEWFCADVRRFGVRSSFHAAYSMFDSLNHLLTPGELVVALRNVSEALVPGGLLVFDVNSEEGFRERWVSDYRIETLDGDCHLQGCYDAESRLGRYRFTVCGRGEDAWRCADFEFTERCYSDAEVRAALTAAGFAEVEAFDAAVDLDLKDQPGRVFYSAIRLGG